ncbi:MULTISPECIES: LysE family translocator [unclassified Shewanella]|uniref:LysE family translocator n=1 Tax=unclassified Shewanella TaxID=196818 RepID=UPI000C85AB4E|nr:MULTISPECIES: LysE family translocator [unclassified Shewanella]MDO6619173.1 LysE family translocator [Shewanella sp. 6_MG-2023]MDO6677257.1 LysE family translocator [Shewanella sp. 4_MG-2023]MDO6773919.1 LysE family translocator [Shewanella sp. 3_MG-2023]PMG31618.1 lysine transporter LysE [Shewanella sp. 10N.286.52.C2]PMG39439.1 lysine transporter LysE [Shewanella sp. 10N.286.52.B9]
MAFSTWLGLLAICCLGAMSPGPSLAMVLKHTLSGGRLHGVVCAWAHSIGIGVYALVTLLGLAVVLEKSPIVFNGIAILGALYLAWMGFQALNSKGGMEQKLQAGVPASLLEAARDGLAISLFNPKILLFFLALFSQFVLAAETMAGQTVIVLTPLVVDGLWYTLIAVVLSHGPILNRLRNKAALIDKLSGVVLILLAVRVLINLF